MNLFTTIKKYTTISSLPDGITVIWGKAGWKFFLPKRVKRLKFELELSEEELKALFVFLKEKEEELSLPVILLLRKVEQIVFHRYTIDEVESFLQDGKRKDA